MNTHSLKVLEFDKIREFLKTFAASPGGRRLCDSLTPSFDRESVEALLNETTEMKLEIECNGALPLNGIYDIKDWIGRSKIRNFYLEPKALVQISETLETADILRNYFAGLEETRPCLFLITRNSIPLHDLSDAIRKSISPQGEILDDASTELAEIRRRLKKLRLSVIKTLEQMITDDQTGSAVQDDFITLRNNRYVIPVRSDSKNSIPGVVHDQSQSKATFFIEPLAVVNLNNELQILHKEEYYEEIRILTALTRRIADNSEAVLHNLAIVERIDLIHARALLSTSLNACPPALNNDRVIELNQCRHPILLGRFIEDKLPDEDQHDAAPREVMGHWEFNRPGIMPVDLLKRNEISTLIITGANAGGKTVAMKTLGLFVLMTQAGLHIPVAEHSTICIYDTVYADIGDEQNIEASLSTFSAHMAQIKAIVTSVSENSLVLFDELGSGTDPAEGGALAVAILDYLRKRGCISIVTTHLNLLKTYAYSHADVENVSVAFDPVTFKPTYSLVYGVPGISNALAIARTIGIPHDILVHAETYLQAPDRQITELIHGLEKTQNAITEEKSALARIKQLAARYLKASENLVEGMKLQRQKLLTTFETSARTLLRESETELMKLIKEQKKRTIIRPDQDVTSADAAKEAFGTVKKKLFDKFPQKAARQATVEHLEAGQTVHVIHLQKNGIVVSADNQGKKAEIAVGSLRVKTGFNELELRADEHLPEDKEIERPRVQPSSRETPFTASQKINVIGMRIEEALPVVDKTIDSALMHGTDTVEIIHGKGTGRLMNAIHEHLKNNRYVSTFASGSAGEGGSGITIVHIK